MVTEWKRACKWFSLGLKQKVLSVQGTSFSKLLTTTATTGSKQNNNNNNNHHHRNNNNINNKETKKLKKKEEVLKQKLQVLQKMVKTHTRLNGTLSTGLRWSQASKIARPIIIMYIYHALINALSTHMIHINLNMIFYTHIEHSPIIFYFFLHKVL